MYTAPPEIYTYRPTLPLHDALPISAIAISCPSATENRIYSYGGSNGALQNLGNGYYQLDWMGAYSLRGYCRRLELNLGDGEVHPALFRSEEHTSELQSLMRISYAGFCLKKKKQTTKNKYKRD